ncbi:hypothetical protein DPMN_099975 [Dreissena polymorpha]|uniref:HAT C-terminal dimerisation domain-containing protein n=1 Tax=Dreissena polymorpha TaxID=45954 RepID=A0A9D4R7R9_DREPO|nr:hypothetical protein DPMN_099975 [Dreissena polymorpha]
MLELAMLIPQSTAVVERSFSAMNDICPDLRTSLSTKHLDDLMRISSYQHDFSEIEWELLVDKFKNAKQREMAL